MRSHLWNSRLLASIATDLEFEMEKHPDHSDAAHQLFHAIEAVEAADYALGQVGMAA